MEEKHGGSSQEHVDAKAEYKRMDKAADSKGLVMVPVGSLEKFWNAIRSGGLPH